MLRVILILSLCFWIFPKAFASQYDVAASAVRVALRMESSTLEFETALAARLEDPKLQARIVAEFRGFMKTEGYSDLHLTLTPVLKELLYGLSANTHRALKKNFWIHDPAFHEFLAERLSEETKNPEITEQRVSLELRQTINSLERRARSVKKVFILNNGMHHPTYRRIILKMLGCQSLLENP